jgi:hypothetical protein
MQQLIRPLAIVAVCAVLALPQVVAAQTTTVIPPELITPDQPCPDFVSRDGKEDRRAKNSWRAECPIQTRYQWCCCRLA